MKQFCLKHPRRDALGLYAPYARAHLGDKRFLANTFKPKYTPRNGGIVFSDISLIEGAKFIHFAICIDFFTISTFSAQSRTENIIDSRPPTCRWKARWNGKQPS